MVNRLMLLELSSRYCANAGRCTQADRQPSSKMKKNILIFIMVTTGLFSCTQGSKSTSETAKIETINSVRNYEYADSTGNRLIILNSFPKSKINYTSSNGKKYVYAVFWTQITNETNNSVELKIDFPLDSFEFPRSSGNYLRLLIPSDTMRLDKAALSEYGLDVKSLIDTRFNKSYSLKRNINPKDSTAFYVVAFSNGGAGGALRTGLSLVKQTLFYKLSLFNNRTSDLALMDMKEIDCGSINLKNLILRK